MKNLLYLKKYLFLIGYICIIVFLCFEALKSGADSQNTSNKFQEIIGSTPPYQYLDSKIPNFDKVTRKLFGHFLLYSLLGLFSYFTYNSFINKKIIAQSVNLSSGFILSVFTEFLQVFASERGPAFQDVIINFEGFLLTNILILLFIIIFITKNIEKIKLKTIEILLVFGLAILFIFLFIIFAKKINSLLFCNMIFVIATVISIILILIKYFAAYKKSR